MNVVTGKPIPVQARRRGSYGIDAPKLLPVLTLLFIADLAHGVLSRSVWPVLGAVLILCCAGLGLYASRRGKFLVWTELLDQLRLRGDERILDIGCGRGAVLMLAAQHVTTGRAIGIDLWKRGDQSGNSAQATERNAVAEGVASRVELCTADMTVLPFERGSFDVILSNIAIHNVSRPGRDKVMQEVVRVLRPGGKLVIADLLATRQYAERLRELGMASVRRTGLGWRMWWTGPWLSTHLVTASKPPVGNGVFSRSQLSLLTES